MNTKKILSLILCIIYMFGLGVVNVSAAETVNVTTVSALQSAHNYTDNTDKTWVYTHSTSADSLKVTFSSDTATEAKYDFIYIIDGSGNQIGKYDGTTLAGQTITVPGDVVKIRLTSDYSNTGYGFRVTNIEAVSSNTGTINVSTVTDLQSAHNYANNMDKTWVYTHSTTADSLSVTFSSDTETENNYDYIYILDGNSNQIGKYCGTSLAGQTISVPGNVIKIRLTSDSSQTKYGFRVTNIETNYDNTSTVNVSTMQGLQSAHNYADNTDKTWVYTHPTAASSLKITFSSDTEVENGYDYIYILDGNDNQIGKYTGKGLSGQTVAVCGNVIKIRLKSDNVNNKFGFAVTEITANVETTHRVSSAEELQSEHPYVDGIDETWIYTHPTTATGLKITFSNNTSVETDVDYIHVFDGSDNLIGRYTGSILANKPLYVPGNVIKIRLETNGISSHYHGFSVTEVIAYKPTSLTGFSSGNGTKSSPYIIKTATQLKYFIDQLATGYDFIGEYISLGANIDITSYTFDTASCPSFAGFFSGNGYTITTNSQLFNQINIAGVVDWLNLTATQTLKSTLMCTINYGTIQNCRVRGDVSKSGDAGLMCSYNYGNIYNSCGFGSLNGSGNDNDCWVGWVLQNSGTIQNCYTVLTLSGYASGRYNSLYMDGIAVKRVGGTVENCFTEDTVVANDQAFVNKLNQLNVVSGYSWALDSANQNDGYPVIEKCLDATSELSYSSEAMFTFHSSSITSTITSNVSGCKIYYTLDGTNPTTSSTRKTYSSSLTFLSDFEIRTTAYKDGMYSVPRVQYGIKLYGSGTESNPYQIKSNLGLYAIRFAPEKCYSLESNLDFTNDDYITNGAYAEGWTPIPSFTGIFNGNSHSITGIAGTMGGLFDSNDGTIKNLRLLSHRLCNKNGDFGSIANDNSGLISRCYSSTDKNPPYTNSYIGSYVGGIAGVNTGGEIAYCYTTGLLGATADVSYSHYSMGGIAGRNGTVRSCMSDINIITPYSSHDLGCDACGMVPGGSSIDCRYDGEITVNAYDAFVSIGSNSFSPSQSNDTLRCYDGGFVLKRASGTYGRDHINGGTNCYKYSNTYRDYLESSFPEFDFTTTWMITPDGPMPQGVMNADGNYYTKKSYTAPTCTTDGSTVCLDRNNQTVTFKLDAYGHNMNEGCCTRCSYKEIYNIELKNNTNNSLSELYKDCSYQLEALLTPADAIDKTITWTSSDATIATVSQNGLLSCLNCGTVKITATANNGVKAEIELNIIETPYLNDIAVSGTPSAVVGDLSINHQVILSTNKDVNALYCFIKYPAILTLKSVTAKDFVYAGIEDEYTEDGFTTAVILAQYSETDLIPKNEILTPFEITFDVSKSALPGTVQIEVTEESCLIGNETYFFEERISGGLEILPKLAEGIEISGADVISSTTTYTAIVTPDYTTDKSVEWSVDNEAIATVDETGVVTPVTSGTITLTATSKDGSGIVATKTIQVTQGVTGIEIAGADSITEATTYSANILPDYATNQEVEWSISDEEIATIDQNGLVTPVTSGLVTITATAKDGSGVSVSKDINIIKLTETIEITGEDSISSPAQYTAIVSPDYTSDKEVSWSVDNEAIATVDELGIVTPVTSGLVTITATAKDGSGIIATKAIEIVKYAESIEIVGSEEITEPSQYSVVILPEYTTNKDAEWSVSDETIATVDENGFVTPLKNGKIVLTAKAEDASGLETTKSIVITVSVRANSITSDVGVWDKDFDSDITEYIISVPSETSVIYLTSSFMNAMAKVNGSIAANGMRKKVTLTGPETNIEILLTPTTGNTLKANTYKIIVVRGSFTKTTVSEDGKSFVVTPVNIENGKTVILALYNGEQFVEMQSAICTGDAIPFTTEKAYTNAKVMVWDDLTNLKPVCEVETIE